MKSIQARLNNYVPKKDLKPIHSSEFFEELKMKGIFDYVVLPKSKHRDQIRKYPASALLGLIALKHMKGVKSDRKMIRVIDEYSSHMWTKLGFDEDNKPRWHSISNFRQHVLTIKGEKEFKRLIDFLLDEKSYVITDNACFHNKPKLKDPLKLLPTKHKKKIIKDIKKFIFSLKDNNKLAPNIHFTDKDIFDAITFMIVHRQTPNAFSEANRFIYEPYERGDAPSDKTVLNWIRHMFKTRESVTKFHNYVIKKIFIYIKENMPHINKRKGMIVAIDHHLIPTWEDLKKSELQNKGEYQTNRELTNPEHIILNAKDNSRGTTKFRKYISVSIVVKGMRFCMGYKSMTQFNNTTQEVLISDLINYVKKYVGIKLLLLDRNFDNVRTHKLLQRRGIKYIMPKVINGKELRKHVEFTGSLPEENDVFITKYNQRSQGKNVTFRVIFIKKEKKKEDKEKVFDSLFKEKNYVVHSYCTNFKIKSKKAGLLVEKHYRKRWGIETFYKDSKKFFIKSTTNNSIIRDFFFAQSSTVFNIWVLCNLILFVIYLKQKPDKPKIRIRTFAMNINGAYFKKDPPTSSTKKAKA